MVLFFIAIGWIMAALAFVGGLAWGHAVGYDRGWDDRGREARLEQDEAARARAFRIVEPR